MILVSETLPVPDKMIFVREVKAMMAHNATLAADEHLRLTLSPQILFFLEIKRKLAEECDAFLFDTHHKEVDPFVDIQKVAANCLREQVYTLNYDRDSEQQVQALDLFIMGQEKLSNTRRLSEYKSKISEMGFRGIVELRAQASPEGDDEAENDGLYEEEFEIEEDNIILGAQGGDNDWL